MPIATSRPSDIVSIDIETRSSLELKKSGAYRYAMDPSTDVGVLPGASVNRKSSLGGRPTGTGVNSPSCRERWHLLSLERPV